MLNCQKLIVKNCQCRKIVAMLLQFCVVVSKFCAVVMNFFAKKGCLGILCNCCNFFCSKHDIPLCWSNDTQSTPLHCAMHQNKGLIPFNSFTKLIALVQKFCTFGATFITFITCFFYSLQLIY